MGCATSSPEDTSSARDFAMVPATPDGPPRPHPADVETPAQRRRRLRAARPPPNSTSPPHADLPGLKRLPPSAATAVSDDRPSTDSRRENSVATNSTGSRQVNAADPLGGLASAESSMDAIPMPQREERLPPAATAAAVHAEVAQGSLNPLSESSLVVTTATSHNSVGVVPLATTDTSTSLTTTAKPPAATLGVSTTLGASRNHLRRFPGADTHLSSSSLSSSRRQQGAPPRQGAAATSSRQASSGRSFLLASSFFGHRSASHDAGGAQ